MMAHDDNWLGPKTGSHMVVAGGCGGIGRELVAQALAHGVNVTVLDLPKAIRPDCRVAGARYVGFDALEEQSIIEAVGQIRSAWRNVDAFVFLCGYPILPRRPLAEVALSAWNDLMSVNLTSAHILVRELLPLLRASETPSITTVASSLGYQVMPGMGAYAASKGALVSLTKAFAMELALMCAPMWWRLGPSRRPFWGGTGREDIVSDRGWFDQLSDKHVSSIPLGRVASPADIVGPILFLSGPGAGYITGRSCI